MSRPLAAAAAAAPAAARSFLAGKVSQVKQTVSRSQSPVNGPLPAPKPAPRPWAETPIASRIEITRGTLHALRNCYIRNVAGDLEKQHLELKMRLVALQTHQLRSTADEIMNDTRLDLESLPLVTKDDVSECINRYMRVLRVVEATDSYYNFLIFLVIGDYIEFSTSPTELVEILRKQNVLQVLDIFDLTSVVEKYVKLCDIYQPSISEILKIKLLERLEEDRFEKINGVFTMGLNQSLFEIPIRGANEC